MQNSTTTEVLPIDTFEHTATTEVVQPTDVHFPRLVKDESYLQLVEEIKATETEASFTARISVIQGYYAIGTLIKQYQEERNIGVTGFIKELSLDLKYAERSLWFAKKMADTWKTEDDLMNNLPDGKATSWTKVKALLGDSTNTDEVLDVTKIARGIVRRYGEDVAQQVGRELLNASVSSQDAPGRE
jgi:hypothetical protein